MVPEANLISLFDRMKGHTDKETTIDAAFERLQESF